MTEPTSAQDLLKGRHFDQEIIILCVRWYITFKLSFRDLVQMMAERGITLSHTTILRWVQQYVPEFEKRWSRYARPVGDFLLSKRRDVTAAKRFFSRAAKQHGVPKVITLDGYTASHRVVDKLKTSGILPRRVQVRSCKYLNNVIEQPPLRKCGPGSWQPELWKIIHLTKHTLNKICTRTPAGISRASIS
jgi:transposase-like protein